MYFDIHDLGYSKENMEYLCKRLDEAYRDVYESRQINLKLEKQFEIELEEKRKQIAELETKISVLQKTLEVISLKTPRVCKRGGVGCGRAQNVCKNHHR